MKGVFQVPLWLIPGALLAGLLLVVSGSRTAVAWWVEHRPHPHDPLEWIQREFHPNPDTLSALRQIHDRYEAPRRQAAERLHEQRRILTRRAADDSPDSPPFQPEAERWDQLVAESHALTWRYVFEMARELPPPEGRRFRAEMARMILGSAPPDFTPPPTEARP